MSLIAITRSGIVGDDDIEAPQLLKQDVDSSNQLFLALRHGGIVWLRCLESTVAIKISTAIIPTEMLQNTDVMSNQYKQGEHVCAFYATEKELLTTAAEYVADGLRAERQCFVVAASRQMHLRLRRTFSLRGVDVSDAIRAGALREGLHADVHLAHGGFNTERMLRLLNEGIETALNDGFTGLRCCGDMSWLLHSPSAHRQVFEYEALLNALFRSTPAEAMCLYPSARFPPEWLAEASDTHSSRVLHGAHTFNGAPSRPHGAGAQPAPKSRRHRHLRRRT